MAHDAVRCDVCATAQGTDGPLGWSASHSDGELVWLCGPCTREHARAIEARLDPEWW